MKLIKKAHRVLLLLSKNPIVKKEIEDRLREITGTDKLYVVKSKSKHKWCICSENPESKDKKRYVCLFKDIVTNHIRYKHINSSYLPKRSKENWRKSISHTSVITYDRYISSSDVTGIYELSDIIMDDCIINMNDIDKSYLKSVTNRINSKDNDYLVFYGYRRKKLYRNYY